MNDKIFIILQIATICFSPTLAHPDLLKQQRYEFQELHTSSAHDPTARHARHEIASVPVVHVPTMWSQQHKNEVNAFAEMFRQNYNQMVKQYNTMMQTQDHALTNLFVPVTYVLYQVPDEVVWKNYFGNQQQYVYDKTEQMAQQLIHSLKQGHIPPQDLMNPNFFLSHAATELNRVHQIQNEFETNDEHVPRDIGDTYQRHKFDTFDTQQQQQNVIFTESQYNQEIENTDQILVYNHNAVTAQGEPPHEELAEAMTSNVNVQHPSNIQRLPPVRFNNVISNEFSQTIEKNEVHTPISVETVKLPLHPGPAFNSPGTTDDAFYGSTYDQQPIYDLRYVETVSSTAMPSMVNVMSLVRNKIKVKISTTTIEPSTTTSTTTELPITESNIMSMLPNKKPSFNYTDIYHKVQAELRKQMEKMPNNKSEETHFMGMSSNIDQIKLSYETVVEKKDYKESRGDQPGETDDYISEQHVESEPGESYYSVTTEAQLDAQTTPLKTFPTLSPISSTTKPIRTYQNQFYTATLAFFPTTTNKPPNPYYSAPLAPFPDEIFQESQVTTQPQKEHFELLDMNQEAHVIGHQNDNHFVDADTAEEYNEQQNDDIILDNSELQISYDIQQHENVQQRYFDIADVDNTERMINEKQLPPEQSYRNPDIQLSGFAHSSNISAHVREITETPTSVDNKTQKNWLQRQFSKIKNAF